MFPPAQNSKRGSYAGLPSGEVSELLHEWAMLETRARLIVSAELQIIWSNAAAISAMKLGRDVRMEGGRLYTADRGMQRKLSLFIAGCSPAPSHWNMLRSDYDGHVIFCVQRLPCLAAGVIAGLSFFGTGSDFFTPLSTFDGVFKLTQAQSKVVADLLDGLSHEEVATRRGISINTVRSHVAAVYAELDVTSKEAMFLRLRPYHS